MTKPMTIEQWPPSRVKPYAGNPRKNEQAVDAVAKSIREFGWQQPIVVDGDGVIIVGHTRHKAALKLGLAEVPVVVADLPPEKARAYRIADNQTNTLAEWDYSQLMAEVAELQGLNVDLSILGFSEDELTGIMSSPPLPEKANGTEYDESVAGDVELTTCPKCQFQFPK